MATGGYLRRLGGRSSATGRSRRHAPPRPASRSSALHPDWFQLITVAACAVTIWLTWPLWQVRAQPPLLPIVRLPQVAAAWPLLAALALTLFRPRAGVAAYGLVLAYAILLDRTRVQPAMVSLGLLLTANAGAHGRTIARAHLLTLWFYAGLNKLLSPQFMHDPNPFLLRAFVAAPPAWLAAAFPAFVVAAESGLALAAAWPPARTVAAFWAGALHLGILAPVSPLGHDWNQSVWAWNVILALSGFFLIRPWRESVPVTLRAAPRPVRIAVLALAVFPLAFHVGVGDPYLAHNLYSRNTPTAYVCNTERRPQAQRPGLGHAAPHEPGEYHCRIVDFLPSLNVPEPPEHALFEDYFAATCADDEALFIYERRLYYIARGQERRVLYCR